MASGWEICSAMIERARTVDLLHGNLHGISLITSIIADKKTILLTDPEHIPPPSLPLRLLRVLQIIIAIFLVQREILREPDSLFISSSP